ncbi:hypothetical protein [Catellatospora sichuanensis]|nr:hypothetical protein [Catellatospora sichuanensis]
MARRAAERLSPRGQVAGELLIGARVLPGLLRAVLLPQGPA